MGRIREFMHKRIRGEQESRLKRFGFSMDQLKLPRPREAMRHLGSTLMAAERLSPKRRQTIADTFIAGELTYIRGLIEGPGVKDDMIFPALSHLGTEVDLLSDLHAITDADAARLGSTIELISVNIRNNNRNEAVSAITRHLARTVGK